MRCFQGTEKSQSHWSGESRGGGGRVGGEAGEGGETTCQVGPPGPESGGGQQRVLRKGIPGVFNRNFGGDIRGVRPRLGDQGGGRGPRACRLWAVWPCVG